LLWNGTAELQGTSVAIPDPAAYHDYRLEYTAGSYSLYIDGTLSAGPIPSSLRPTTISFGNPFAIWWGASNWTAFTLDSMWASKNS
jgi:hypothetical protein